MIKPIAIIGMGAILPDAMNISEYWSNILAKKDCIRDIPDLYWDINDYYDPDPAARDKCYTYKAGVVGSIEFDSMGFGIPPTSMESISVEQLYALVVAKQALLDAGMIGKNPKPFDREKAGVILAATVGKSAFSLFCRQDIPKIIKILKNSGAPDLLVDRVAARLRDSSIEWTEDCEPGFLGNVTAGRIANRFNLNGTNMAVDAACASGLAALKVAVAELLTGDCDIVLAGGVNLDLSSTSFISFCKTPAISHKGVSRPFDAEGDGMILGDGVAMVVLKRLEDAERDNDRIYAVIRSVGSSGDGRGKSIFAPNVQGQIKALQRAYGKTDVDPATVALIEAHGTGTHAGDECELTALRQFFEEGGAAPGSAVIGSVKSQIGHTRMAAGMAGLVKTALAIYHRTLPSTINVDKEHPALTGSPFYLLSSSKPWITSGQYPVRRAGISAFGFGGANYHGILEDYPRAQATWRRLHQIPAGVCLHASDRESLASLCSTYAGEIAADSGAYFRLLDKQLDGTPPSEDEPRIGFVAENAEDAVQKLRLAVELLGDKDQEKEAAMAKQGLYYRTGGLPAGTKIVTLFSGQGSQYIDMFSEIARDYPEMTDFLEMSGAALESRDLKPIAEVLYPGGEKEKRREAEQTLKDTKYTQPALGAVCGGLYEIIRNRNYKEDFLIGHSFGELTCLWAGGAIDAKAFVALAADRGLAMASGTGETGMIAVAAGQEACAKFIEPYDKLCLANVNSPEQIVVSGEMEQIKALHNDLREAKVSGTILNVSQGFHSPYMAEPNRMFYQALDETKFSPLINAVYSGAEGKLYGKNAAGVKKTLAGQIEKPVLFSQCIESVYKKGARVFLEIGPGNVLTKLTEKILQGKELYTVAVNGFRSAKNVHFQLEDALVRLRILGLNVGGDPYRVRADEYDNDQPPKSAFTINPMYYLTPQTHKSITESMERVDPPYMPAEGLFDNGRQSASDALVANSDTQLSNAAGAYLSTQPSGVSKLTQPETKKASQEEYMDSIDPGNRGSAALAVGNAEIDRTEKNPMRGVSYLGRDTLESILGIQSLNGQAMERFLASQGYQIDVFVELLRESGANGQTSELIQLIEAFQHNSLKAFESYMQGQRQILTGWNGNDAADYGSGNSLFAASGTEAGLLPEQSGWQTGVRGVGMPSPADGRGIGVDARGLGISPTANVGDLGTPSPADVNSIGVLSPTVIESAWSTPAYSPSEQDQPTTIPTYPGNGESPAANGNRLAGIDRDTLVQTMLQIIGEKTGYPEEMLDPEMNFESDLGIDSIKRVEILAEMNSQFPGCIVDEDIDELAMLHTIYELADYLLKKN